MEEGSVRSHSGGHRAEAAIDVHDLPRDTAGQVGKQECRDITNFVYGDIATQRRVLRDMPEDLGKPADSGCSQRLDWARGYTIHSSAFGSQGAREITYVRFQAGLRETH